MYQEFHYPKPGSALARSLLRGDPLRGALGRLIPRHCEQQNHVPQKPRNLLHSELTRKVKVN